MPSPPPETIQYACLSEGIVVIRVNGKGTHLESPILRHVFEQTRKNTPPARYVIDLDKCKTMDSTFMGTLASIGLHQRNSAGSSLIVVNANEHAVYLLNTLGLKYILDVRQEPAADARQTPGEAFTPATAPKIGAIDRILMMIEAHECLIDVDGQNEVKFEGVLKHLRESLEREQEQSHH
jgi:anti-anti-sigma factor